MPSTGRRAGVSPTLAYDSVSIDGVIHTKLVGTIECHGKNYTNGGITSSTFATFYTFVRHGLILVSANHPIWGTNM